MSSLLSASLPMSSLSQPIFSDQLHSRSFGSLLSDLRSSCSARPSSITDPNQPLADRTKSSNKPKEVEQEAAFTTASQFNRDA